MSQFKQNESWVIYQTITSGSASGPQAVCEQKEWEKLERDHPGMQTLIHSGIASEGAAEQLARGTSGDARPKPRK
jgi:hypothetical protein